MTEFLFIAGAALALMGGLIAVIARNLFHASLGLAMTLTGTAGLFIPLGGELISVVQILVYLGAVAVAIIFILMLSPPFYLKRPHRNPATLAVAALIGVVFSIPLLRAVFSIGSRVSTTHVTPTAQEIGKTLLTEFVFPFEIISVLLTVAIIGAIVLARDLPEDDKPHTATSQGETK